ncbi:cytochrome c [Octadecabacter arcticus]|nr:cytochrome c [Octadecabacter arcticus]
MMKFMMVLMVCILPSCIAAQDKTFTLSAPIPIVDTGFLQHLLPRFSLKHGVRVQQVPEGGDVVIGAGGIVVFSGLDAVWSLAHNGADGPLLFVEWLTSDIGKRTIASFKPDGVSIFSGDVEVETVAAEVTFQGDTIAGETLSLRHCGRCHVINQSNRMNGMEQTPSFALLRTFSDWQDRFSRFYVRNPHPSFTQVINITAPFERNLPPAIVPLEITQDELDSILAYVATIPPADLGAPLQNH